jgi:ribonuclease HI
MKQPSLHASPVAGGDWVAYIDGGARGNPGPAGYGVVIQDGGGQTLETLSRSIGKTTNNVAEYQALFAALQYVLDQRGTRLRVNCDSELIVRQMQGRYRVKSPDLLPLHQRARELAGRLDRFAIQHIPREQNAQADRLANDAMNQAQEAPSSPAASQTLIAVCDNGLLRPLSPAPALEEGAEYEVRLRKR